MQEIGNLLYVIWEDNLVIDLVVILGVVKPLEYENDSFKTNRLNMKDYLIMKFPKKI